MLSFSVIIPCFHDEEKLACLLTQLQKLPNKPWEIIVVDASNSESCAELLSLIHISEPTRPY